MSSHPTDISADQSTAKLSIIWQNGDRSELPFFELRCACHCAGCVDEQTGERILDIKNLPADIKIVQMEMVGSYAIRIVWSDGHDTGLYTWERLSRLDSQNLDQSNFNQD